jgi:hypothetical protein
MFFNIVRPAFLLILGLNFAITNKAFSDSSGIPKLDVFRLSWSSMQDVFSNTANRPAEPKKREEYPRKWIVAEFDGKKVTNRDLEQFIQNSTVSDASMIQMFREENEAMDNYVIARDNKIYFSWRESLKKFLYYKLMEKEALRMGKDRPFFTTSQKTFDRMCDDSEREILKKLLDEGKGIQYAREKFADFLISQHYPHHSGEERLDIYFHWLKINEGRIKESIRRAEVERMEHSLAHPRARKDYFPAIAEMHQIFQQSLAKTQAFFNNSSLDSNSINSFFQQNPDARLSVTKINSLSLDNSPLSAINSWDSTRFQQEHARLVSQLTSQLTNKKLLSIQQHLQTATLFAQKYSQQELMEKQKLALDAFTLAQQGNYQHLFLSKIYHLASFNSSDLTALRMKQLLDDTNSIRISLLEQIQNPQYFLNSRANDYNAGDYLFNQFYQAMIKTRANSSEYEKAIVDLLAWMIKFEIKKIALVAPVYYVPNYAQYTDSTIQKAVENFQIEGEYNRKLNALKQRLKQRYRHSFRINPEGNGFWEPSESINFIIPR